MKRLLSSIFIVVCACICNAQTTFLFEGRELTTDTHTWLVCSDENTDDTYVYSSLRKALQMVDSIQRIVPQGTYSEQAPLKLYISPGVYWIDDPDDPSIRRALPGDGIPYGLKIKASHLCLIGMSANPEHTILASNRGQTQGAIGNFTMLHLTGEDIEFENLTLGNYCNVDLVYSLDSSFNRKRRADAIVQAQLAICQGDKIAAYNCRFISRLNTCPLVGARRTYFDNCYFECTDDALCGTGVYHRCTFNLFSGKPFYNTQGTGAVFLNCKLFARTSGKQYLVKVGSPVTMVDCQWICKNPNVQICWTQDPTDDLRSYQYNLTQDGEPLLIDKNRSHLTVDMSGLPLLEAYRIEYPDTIIYNLRNLLSGEDGWNPAHQPDNLPSRPISLCLNHRHADIESGVDTLHLRACRLGFMQETDFIAGSKNIHWHTDKKLSDLIKMIPQKDGSLIVHGQNEGETPCTLTVIATDSSGLEAACVISVRPRQLPPPTFTELPHIIVKEDSLTLQYALQLDGRTDQSNITWWRSPTRSMIDAIPIAVSRNNTPKHSYRPTAADKGYYIHATISPKHQRSKAGEIQRAVTTKKIRTKATRIDSIVTDFTHFPTMRQSQIREGAWTLDAYKPLDTHVYDWKVDTVRPPWHYGRGVDGAANSWGLIQGVRGARLLYTPLDNTCDDMEITLRVDPCKSAGQGFGSATGQYMDIYIKFDTRTLTGYALRIERTVKHDRAVDFTLMRYDNGKATPITTPLSAICYRRGCVIQLSSMGNRLTAHVYNELELPAPHHPHLSTEVHLEAEVTPLPFNGLGIQHTGSVGSNVSVLRELTVKWH